MIAIRAFEELKRLVVASGISIHALSKESTVSRETIAAWLDGKTQTPRIDTMMRVAKVVGQEIELTPSVKKMLGFFPEPKPRFQLWRFKGAQGGQG